MLRLILLACSTWLAQAVIAAPDTTGRDHIFFRGPEYTKIVAVGSGSPYLYEDSPGIRKVHYYGQWFSGVELHYDAEDDVLMTREVNGAIRMSLVKEKVSAFYLGAKKFELVPGVGFCEVLYEGGHRVYLKWQKVLVRQGVEDPYYRTYQRVFVSDKETLVEVSGRNDIFAILGKKGRQAAEYARQQRLNFKKELPKAASLVMQYADQNHLYD